MGCLATLLALVSCAGSASDLDMLRKQLESSVGRQFETTMFSKPTASRREREFAVVAGQRQFRFTWLNGCQYTINVSDEGGVVSGWAFNSDEELCRAVARHALGS